MWPPHVCNWLQLKGIWTWNASKYLAGCSEGILQNFTSFPIQSQTLPNSEHHVHNALTLFLIQCSQSNLGPKECDHFTTLFLHLYKSTLHNHTKERHAATPTQRFFLRDNLPKVAIFFLEGSFGDIFSLFQCMKSLDCYQFQGGIIHSHGWRWLLHCTKDRICTNFNNCKNKSLLPLQQMLHR